MTKSNVSMTKDEKSNITKLIITWGVSFIPELLFSWIIGKIFDASLWYVWIGLQVFKIFLWFLKSVTDYLLFHLVWKYKMIDDTYASLVQHKYPNPSKYTDTPSDFFMDAMWDFQLDEKTRLDAATMCGVLKYAPMTFGFWGGKRVDRVMKEAIDKYHRINFSGKIYEEFTEQSLENEYTG